MNAFASSERAGRIEELFDALVDRAPEERTAYLERACSGDVQLRREVESLLAAYDAHGPALHGLLEELPHLAGASAHAAAESTPYGEATSGEATYGWAGQRIAHYEILERLGRGGMGVVYRARDTKLERTVALKFLPPHLDRDEAATLRLIREAKAASALDHPRICTIYEIGETDERQLFLAMAYYAGETLQAKIQSRPQTTYSCASRPLSGRVFVRQTVPLDTS